MKSERRHELEKNILADRLGGGLQAAQPVMPMILGAIAILVVGSLGWGIYSSTAKKKSASAWTEYYFNLTGSDPGQFVDVADDFPSSSAAGWARLTAGNMYLEQGVEAIYRNRAEGEKLLNQAIEAFEDTDLASAAPQLRHKSQFGLAQAYEALGDLDQAAKYYEQVSSSTAYPALVADAKERLTFVSSDAGKSFYAWFDTLDPKPDAPIQLPSNLSLPPTSPGDLEFGDLPLNLPAGGDAPGESGSETPAADPAAGLQLDPATLPELPDTSQSPSGSGGESEAPAAGDGAGESAETPAAAEAAADASPASGQE